MAAGSWRTLKLEAHDAFVNMAIDEAILTAKAEGLVPNTLRLYQWKPSAVSIGRFQMAEKEVLVENCKRYGVDLVRRITGGGAVYHDAEGELTYSLCVSKKDLKTEDMAAIYKRIYSGLVRTMENLGLTADFDEGDAKTCPNLTIKGKKISGSAQSHRKGTVLQHGTFLVNVDLDRMFTFLHVPWARTLSEIVNIAEKKITSLNMELGKKVPIDEVSEALITGFQKALSVELAEGELTQYERRLAEKLHKVKYTSREWNAQGKSNVS